MLTHHTYYYEGSLGEFDALKAALKPFVAERHERFGIDEARALIALAGLKNFNEALFFIGASSITTEAQQALLKLFEEPQAGTTFVVLVPHGALLPTLKSRMLPYEKPDIRNPKSEKSFQFLKLNQKQRSDFITKFIKDEEALRERTLDLVNGLEAALATNVKKNTQALEDLAMVRGYLADRSPSIKLLLEHLALSLPTA